MYHNPIIGGEEGIEYRSNVTVGRLVVQRRAYIYEVDESRPHTSFTKCIMYSNRSSLFHYPHDSYV
ncbi:hypothetical protein HanXRQr2_Chr10g0423791 [Helianthus annuus]|uniref:Uncharacterized protein n=1 Tax=Helianthus annuus TaxID=4232 RepID=A0A251TH60_HELAN|nr:hypothetical protein HanXRQr2_Chr10g0423791 [Helianthus annuus]